MKKGIFLLVMVVLMGSNLFAQQFDMSAEVRPRFESRHGYKSLAVKDVDGASFISQRTRLNFKYKQDKMKFGLSLQNVRVWGDVSTLSPVDKTSSFHEAWAEATLSKTVSLKMGRQEIIYDDHRIFGSVGWAQQARSHDAFIAKFKPNANNRIDVGLALNADGQFGKDLLYSNSAGYKNFQYAWYHGKFDKLGLSILALNTGVEYLDAKGKQQLAFRQTIGPRLTYKSGKLSANAAAYFQAGKKPVKNTLDVFESQEVSSMYVGAGLTYKASGNFSVGAAIDYLSGKAMSDTTSTVKAFAPLFGTNHKFNGWMDYFYVGNHLKAGKDVGLMDINFTFAYKKDKFSAKLIPHIFSSAAEILDTKGKAMSSSLGTEVDFTMGYGISKNVKVVAGYSMMFGTESMERIKGGSKDESSSWGWLMFVFKPKLFSHTIATPTVK